MKRANIIFMYLAIVIAFSQTEVVSMAYPIFYDLIDVQQLKILKTREQSMTSSFFIRYNILL